MNYKINTFTTDSNRYAEIRLSNGIAYIGEHNFKILKLYDYDLIIKDIEYHITKMRKTGVPNTGKIDLPCGFYMFDSFFSVAGVTTYIGRNQSITMNESSISHMNLSCIGYYTSDGSNNTEDISIKEYGKRLFDLKRKWIKKDMSIGRMLQEEDEEIDWEFCFDNSYPDKLYSLFKDMQNNFSWPDINNMIYTHSLFGQSYTNAVQRVSKYSDSELILIRIPESYIVYDEFRKLLKKYYFKGFKFSDIIFACYVADYLDTNKKIE